MAGELEQIRTLVQQATWRIRLQRMVAGICLAAGPILILLGCAMVSIQLRLTDARHFPLILTAGAVGLALGGLFGWLRRVRPVEVAYHLDRTHDNHDRLGSALEFAAAEPQAAPPSATGPRLEESHFALVAAQQRDAAASVTRLEIARSYPWRLPASIRIVLLSAVFLAAASRFELPPQARPVAPPPPAPQEALLRLSELALQREVARELRAEAVRFDDPQLREVADQYDQLLDQAAQGKIDREAAMQKLTQLQAAAAIPPPGDREAEELTQELAQVGSELKKEKVKEARALGEALEQKDLVRAKEELQRLARLLASDKLAPGQLEALARTFGALAKKLADRLDARDLESLRREVGLLRQKMSKRGLGAREEERLKQLEEHLRRAEQRQGPDPSRKEQEHSLRALNQLHRRSDEAARSLDEAARQRKEEQKQLDGSPAGEAKRQAAEQSQKQGGRKLQEGAQALEKLQQERQRSEAHRKAAQRMEQARENFKRSGQQRDRSQERTTALQDFDRRSGQSKAGETDPSQSDETSGSRHQSERPPDPQDRVQREPDENAPAGPGREQGQPPRQANQLQRRAEQPDARKNQPGTSSEASQGAGTSQAAQHKDEQLAGRAIGPADRVQLFQGAAEQGFAQREYRKVFQEYSGVAEDELERVQVPAGYRFFVRRYFELIRPRE